MANPFGQLCWRCGLNTETMTHISAVIDRIYLVRWVEPDLVGVYQVNDELKRARQELGEPVFGISIIPPIIESPNDDLRESMGKRMDLLLKSAASLHFVVEGTGFRHAIARSVITG